MIHSELPKNIIAEVAHANLVPFLRSHLRLRSFWGACYWLFNIVPVGILIYTSLNLKVTLDEVVKNCGLGFVLFFFLLPVHELIHAAAYKAFGAPRVSFGGDWKKFIVYAAADGFVVDRKKFLVIALAPFIIINLFLLIPIFLIQPPASFVFWGALILHIAGCFGDFALVSFMHMYRNRHIATMDDMNEKKTYFFEQ